jgi:hypothetical protein
MSDMANDILKILRKHDCVGSVMYWPELIDELEKMGHDCHGETAICAGGNFPHVVFWVGVNLAFVTGINELLRQEFINKWASPNPMLAALTYPSIPRLPLATNRRVKSGKADCWLPSGVVLTQAGGVSA